MQIYMMNEHGIRSVFQDLKKILPKEQIEEVHNALYKSGLKNWTRSVWLCNVIEKLTDKANECACFPCTVEIRWFSPHLGHALIDADVSYFDIEEIEE